MRERGGGRKVLTKVKFVNVRGNMAVSFSGQSDKR